MNSQDILNISLAIGVLIIAGCAVLVTYYFVRTLKSVTDLTDSLEDTAQNIKNRLQFKALSFIPALIMTLIGKILKRGR